MQTAYLVEAACLDEEFFPDRQLLGTIGRKEGRMFAAAGILQE
jgi:hypothetical protein